MRHNKYSAVVVLLIATLCLIACGEDGTTGGGTATGEGGSLARFTARGNYLYTVIDQSLSVYEISRKDTLDQLASQTIANDIETIHTQGDYLYLGGQTGMSIYSLENPAEPTFIFTYQHIRSCDPVVVRGNRAYVTLRSGSGCGGSANNLEVIDIENPHWPQLIKSYPLTSPGGLAIDGNLLFVCDKTLKVFDVTSDTRVVLLTEVEINAPYDVIAGNGLAIITSDEGILQYRYSTRGELTHISTIAVEKP
jgi:hypothetical protein